MLWEIENQIFELQTVINLMDNKQIRFIDANQFLQNEQNPNEFYWPIDLHFNEKGYKKYSEFIYNEIIKMKLF